MAAGSGSLSSSQSHREQTDIGAELAAIQEALGDNPLAGRVEHLKGLLDDVVLPVALPVLREQQEELFHEAQNLNRAGDRVSASAILDEQVFQVRTGDDMTLDLRQQIDAVEAEIAERSRAADDLAEKKLQASNLLEAAELAIKNFDFPEARTVLDEIGELFPDLEELEEDKRARLGALEVAFKYQPTKQTLNVLIRDCDPETNIGKLNQAIKEVGYLEGKGDLTSEEATAYKEVFNALKGLLGQPSVGQKRDFLKTLQRQAFTGLQDIDDALIATRDRFANPGSPAAAASSSPAAAVVRRPSSPEEMQVGVEGDFARLARDDREKYVTDMLSYFKDNSHNDLVILEKLHKQFIGQQFTINEDVAKLSGLLHQRREEKLQQLLSGGNWTEAQALIERLHGVNPQLAADLRRQIESFKMDEDANLTDQVRDVRDSGGMTAASTGMTSSGGMSAAALPSPAAADGALPPLPEAAPAVDVPALEQEIMDEIGELNFTAADRKLRELAATSSQNIEVLREMLQASRDEEEEAPKRAFRTRSESRLERVESQPDVVVRPGTAAPAAAPAVDVTALEGRVQDQIVAGEFARAEQLLAELEQTSSTRVGEFRDLIRGMREADQADLAAMQQDKSPSSSGSDGEGGTQGAPPMQDKMAATRAAADGPDPAAAAAPKADAPQTPASADAAPKRALPKRPVKRPAAKQGAARPKVPAGDAGAAASASAAPVDGAVDFNAELSALKRELSKPIGPALIRAQGSIADRLEALKGQVGSDDAKKAALNAVIEMRNIKFGMGQRVEKVA